MLPGSALAQSIGGAGEMPEAKDLVKIHAAPLELKAGEKATVKVALTIAPTWHVNANPPALDYMIPTEVKLTGGPGLTIGHPVYPPAKHVKLSFEETALAVYDGEGTEISVPIEVAANATGGARSLAGQLKFQSCNDQVCLAPATVPFKVALTITGGASAGAGATAAPESTTASAPAESTTTAPATGFSTAPPQGGAAPIKPTTTQGRLEDAMKRGGFAWLLALFVGGMMLNLTPCVFPMLGVTVSVFGARRNEPLPKVVTAATLYVLGICLTYTTLGVIAGLTGGLFGSALQSSWVNVGLGALLAVLSLSMFGMYEMQPPAWLLQRMYDANMASSLGIFVSGLAVGIIAAPCVGPFVVAVLALIAQRANVMFGMQTMFALSLGLGAPYLVLASFSNLLQRLPRSGEWMVWVKKVFGVILLSVGAFYVLVGLAPRLSGWVLPVGLILGGLYLGFLAGGGVKPAFRRVQIALGLLGIVAGAVVIARAPKAGLRLEPFDDAGLKAAFAAGKTVMVDFSADWCVPCHELEHSTFTDDRVRSLARTFVLYQVDLTRYDSPEAERWRRQYGIHGVPTIIFLGPDGREVREARVEGFLAPDAFIERMSAASGKKTAARTGES
jgi:thiol:disulfide interchange protein DsbD